MVELGLEGPVSLATAEGIDSICCVKFVSIPRNQSFPSFAACSPDLILLAQFLDMQSSGSGSCPSGFKSCKTGAGSKVRSARFIAGR